MTDTFGEISATSIKASTAKKIINRLIDLYCCKRGNI
jgi:hypothetical protein